MASSSYKSSWDLSDTVKAKWMSGGTIRLDRRKADILGRVRGNGYKVYIKPATYLAILDKSEEIINSMRDLAEELDPQPTNIHLHGNAILQISYFQKDSNVAELFPYYGIHMVDEEGCIIVGAGINLTQSEFDKFLEVLTSVLQQIEKNKSLTFPLKKMDVCDGVSNKLPLLNLKQTGACSGDSSKPPAVLKQAVICGGGTSKSTSPGLTNHHSKASEESTKKEGVGEGGRKKRKHAGDSVADDGDDKQKIGLTLYGWGWCLINDDGSVKLNGKSQGGWFVDPKKCIEEAMSRKPIDGRNYKMNTITCKKYLDIDHDMFDAALGKLVKDATFMNDQRDCCDGQNEPTILGNISFVDIYGLCEKAIRFYQTLTDKNINHLINLVSEYQKDRSIFYLIQKNYLNKYFVQLFDFLTGK